MVICPHCHSACGTKNGYTSGGRQVMRCRAVGCGRVFVLNPDRPRVTKAGKEIAWGLSAQIGKPLTAAMIAAATGLAERTIYHYRKKQGDAGA